jgi:Motility quorum-sensing regulator, toxin of MqsA
VGTKPSYQLAEVRRLAKLAFVGKVRATEEIQKRTSKTSAEAEAYVKTSLLQIAEADFVETKKLDYSPPRDCDVYRYRDSFGEWYVKFFLQNGRVIVVSFHEPEHLLRTLTEVRNRKGKSK